MTPELPTAIAAGAPSSVRDWLLAGAALVGAACAVGTLIVAVMGLSTWRRQLRGGSRFDVARRTLLAVYRVRNSIRGARRPMILRTEYAERPDRVQKSFLRGMSFEDWDFVFRARYQPVDHVQAELDVSLLEAEVLWGSQLKPAEKLLRATIGRLYIAAGQFVEWHREEDEEAELRIPGQPDHRTSEERSQRAQRLLDCQRTVFAAGTESEDEIDRDLMLLACSMPR